MIEKISRYKTLIKNLESGILGFWIRQYRISYLIAFGIIILGIISLIGIPKESYPSIEFGMVTISTIDIGTNPNDIDSLITDKIYKEIKDIDGIDKIQSTSSLGVSIITLTLKTDANTKDVLNEVRNNVNRVSLPSEAKTPVVTELNTNTKLAFSLYVYPKKESISRSLLIEKTQIIKERLEKLSGIESVKFVNVGSATKAVSTDSGNPEEYEVSLIIPQEKLNATKLTLDSIAASIKAWNKDIPIGNFGVGNKNYDFRIEGKLQDTLSYLSVPLTLSDGTAITLGDIAGIERVYKDKSKQYIGFSQSGSNLNKVIGLSINKSEGTSIFAASDIAKKEIENLFSTQAFSDFSFVYANDLADTIHDDYKELAREALTTLALVFFSMYLFVGFKDSLFATLTLPLAFFSTFILLKLFGFSLNFLTNFSLILSFGIAVDTIIVIVQAASAKVRVGFNPRTAILLALKEYAIPIISGVTTTIVVFIPMMTLPGILGKFLAYIPITIFGVLATGLVLALSVNSALYLLFVKKNTHYVASSSALEYSDEEELEILKFEREGKEEVKKEIPLRLKIIHICTEWYKETLRKFLENTFLRRLSIFIPIVLLVFSFIFLAPLIGFDIFPGDDQGVVTIQIEGDNGLRTEEMAEKISGIQQYVSGMPELKYFSLAINNNIATITLQLLKKDERESKHLRDVFALEKDFLSYLEVYEKAGLKVVSQVQKNGPPGSKAVGLKIIAQKAELLPELINVSKDFEKALKKVPGTKNAGTSSKDTPGQFIFTFKKDTLSLYGISPAIVYGYMLQAINGVTVGTLEDNGTDMNVILKQSNFREKVNIDEILSTTFSIGQHTYQIGNFVDYSPKNAIASIQREDGKILITVDADLEDGVDSYSTQNKFEEFAKSYTFPSGISYEKGGEGQENSELISAILSAFFIAILVIFAILTLQFDSFSQPIIILYSVVMSLSFVMLGLLITGNKFSLPFGIGFISFTGIAVNHGIILLDAINQNLKRGMEGVTALVEAGSSRLEPMTLTTVTTILGILPIALRDKFWSGMGFTIIFGIFAASCLTLFVVKGIYYEVYIAPKERKVARLRKG